MKVFLSYKEGNEKVSLSINGSKSESNRLLLLQAIYPNLSIKNISDSEDTFVLCEGLKITKGKVNVNHAGTAMRFLTAHFATLEGTDILLTGSNRMQQRPIKILVDALLQLGADIKYVNEEGFPPLRIMGKKLTGNQVSLKANVSSQYISALMLIAPSLKTGLNIHLEGKTTSLPYLKMTASLLKKIGVSCMFSNNEISIKPLRKIEETTIEVESDWSSASYFYSLVALSENSSLTLQHYTKETLQGDAELVTIYQKLGVKTVFDEVEKSISLSKSGKRLPKKLSLDLANTPDLAQTIAVSCLGLGIGCALTGLQTLKIKETDRLSALKAELEKLGAIVTVTEDSLKLLPSKLKIENAIIETYNDHRMAMAFAPLSLLFPITINDPMVVEKSFPTFWKCLEKTGVSVNF